MTAPRRIQRRRTKGWRMPANTIYVGRPTKWGNPFLPVSPHPIDVNRSVEFYRQWLSGTAGLGVDPAQGLMLAVQLYELRGKDLVCWCPLGWPCHADVLLELANNLP